MLDCAWPVYGGWIGRWTGRWIGKWIGSGSVLRGSGIDCLIRHDGDGLGTETVKVCSCGPWKKE